MNRPSLAVLLAMTGILGACGSSSPRRASVTESSSTTSMRQTQVAATTTTSAQQSADGTSCPEDIPASDPNQGGPNDSQLRSVLISWLRAWQYGLAHHDDKCLAYTV